MALGITPRIINKLRSIWQRCGIDTVFQKITASPYTLPGLILVAYFALNLGIGGPAYMSDEVGYLDKAAAIAGSTVHFATSWFGGYSFMISPAFFLSSNPYVEWIIVLVLNASMWAGTAALLQSLLRQTHPRAKPQTVWLVSLGALLYPSWLSMSGYAFSTSGFVLVFMGSLVALAKSKFRHAGWLSLAAVLAGYLCWIHPFGFIFLGIFCLVMVFQAILAKSWRLLLPLVIGILTALSYLLAAQPWLNRIMSGSLLNDDHYRLDIARLLHALATPHYWVQVLVLLAGLVLFTLVATFGLAFYGTLDIIKRYHEQKSWKLALQEPSLAVMILSVLLVIATIGLTAFSNGAGAQLRIDQWIYGRYTDMYLLPLIAFGLMSNWKLKRGLWAAGFVLATGFVLSLFTNSTNTSFIFDNKVNLQGFWPMQLASAVHLNDYWIWGILGACGIAATSFMGSKRRKPLLVILLIPVFLTFAGNYLYHRTIKNQHATVSTLYQYIKTNYTVSDCIGFTPAPDSHERFNLYSYYLHGYDMEMMTIDQWQEQGCTGPYLTYSPIPQSSPNLHVIGQEASTGLFVISHYSLPATPILFK